MERERGTDWNDMVIFCYCSVIVVVLLDDFVDLHTCVYEGM